MHQSCPDLTYLQKHLQIHDDDMISTFQDGGMENSIIANLTSTKQFNPISSKITPSTLFHSTNLPPDKEMIQSIMEQVLERLWVS